MTLIAVDMTPVVPQGDNGGAKPLIMELLKGFQRMAVGDRFLILTASWNHEELAVLDSSAMKRLCVVHREHQPDGSLNDRARQSRFRNIVFIVKKIYHQFFQSHSLGKHGVELLFCPFTDPVLAESGIPVVSVIHDLQYREFPHFFTSQEIRHRQSFMREAAQKADAVVCVSEYTRQAAVQSLSILPEKTCVIPNCIQGRLKRLSEEERNPLLRQLGVAQRPYMFYPANFWPHKNHRMLLTAYGMFRSRHPEQQLDLVFTGALTAEQGKLKVYVERMGLSGHVHFLGYLPENALSAVWSGSSCLIFPSLFEGFGIPVLEAMYYSKPVLCSNTSSLPEVAGNAALYFDPRKPEEILQVMVTLTSDPDIRTGLIEKGQQRLQVFQSDDMVMQYLSFFHQTLQKSPRYKNEITGIFPDFWTDRVFSVSVAPGNVGSTVEMVVELPSAVPYPQTILQMKHTSGENQKWKIHRGEEIILHIPVSERGGILSFQLKDTFCPANTNSGEDFRHLGVRCKHCRLYGEDQERIELWPSTTTI